MYGATDIDEDHEARAAGFVTGREFGFVKSASFIIASLICCLSFPASEQLQAALFYLVIMLTLQLVALPTTGPAIVTDSSGDHIQHTQDAVINISGDLYDRAQRWRDLADYDDGNVPSSPRIDPGGCPPTDPRVDKFAAAAYYIR